MLFSDLCQKKLILISGKGGVGKTTVSAALALRLTQEGKKVLIAEIDSQGQIATLFDRPPFGYEETLLTQDLYGLNVTAKESFEEYVVRQLKFHSIYTAVFDNKYVRAFIEGTPGLAELMCIGKIYSMTDKYDVIVLDAPATGHGMSLLQIPTVVATAVRVGPLGSTAAKIEEFLKDPQQTCLANVTLAEEMPVTETLEMESWAKKNLGIDLGFVFINGIYPPLFSNDNDFERCDTFFKEKSKDPHLQGLRKSYHMSTSRAKLHEYYSAILKKELKSVSIIDIPYYFTENLGIQELIDIGKRIANT